jgi:hypothetical protein
VGGCVSKVPGHATTVATESWNGRAAGRAYAPDTDVISIFSAAKTIAKKVVWRIFDEQQKHGPEFVFNAVLPNVVFGRVLSAQNQGVSYTAIINYYLVEEILKHWIRGRRSILWMSLI